MNLSTYSRRPKTFIALLVIASLMLSVTGGAVDVSHRDWLAPR